MIFSESASDFGQFATLLRGVAHLPIGHRVDLVSPVFGPSRGTRVVLQVRVEDSHIQVAERPAVGMFITWIVTSNGAEHCAQLLEELARHGAGHQYLDESGDAQIIASSGEYEDALFA